MSFDMSQLQETTAYAPAAVSADGQGAAVDLQDYIGTVKLIVTIDNTGGDADETIDITVQESSDNAVSDAYTATSYVTTQVEDDSSIQYIDIDTRNVERYIRLDIDVGGTTPVYSVAAAIVGYKNTQ